MRKQTTKLSRKAQKSNSPTILWVDDDEAYISSLASVLEYYGLTVLRAKNTEQAKQVFRDNSRKLSAVILDVMLPVKAGTARVESSRAGLALGSWLLKARPSPQIIGFSIDDSSDVTEWFRDHQAVFFSKRTGKMRILDYVKRRVIKGSSEEILPKVFIVHGRDTATLLSLKNYLQNTLKLGNPTILHEKPSLGRTIIEKFEAEADLADLVFVLLTPDDLMATGSEQDAEKRRARQNVIFELGYFFAKLQRTSGKVLLLTKGKLELPSDISGIVYIDISHGVEAAGESIRREIRDWLPTTAR